MEKGLVCGAMPPSEHGRGTREKLYFKMEERIHPVSRQTGLASVSQLKDRRHGDSTFHYVHFVTLPSMCNNQNISIDFKSLSVKKTKSKNKASSGGWRTP